MSRELFRHRLSRVQVHPNDLKWMPVWLDEYARPQNAAAGQVLVVNAASVLSFLRGLRDRGAPAWQRLQAVRSVEWYQALVLQRTDVDFAPFKQKLGELADAEKRSGVESKPGEGFAGEGLPGEIDPGEPEAIRAMRARLRVLHHPKSTETAYISWVQRFIRHLDDEHLERYGEREIGEFLTDLAVGGEVTAGTQNQALSAILFYYGRVVGRDLHFIQRVRAKASTYRPVVLSQREVAELMSYMRGTSETMFRLMYGSGLRHRECRCLRIKDVCFDTRHIVVRNGKGQQDRVTVLPDSVVEPLRRCINEAAIVHREDVQDGRGRVYLPFALHRKYPNADRELGWQYVFPSRRLSRDPRSGIWRRHHVHERTFAGAMKRALAQDFGHQTGDAAYATAFVCDALTGKRRRYSDGAGTARAQGCENHDDLHTRDEPPGAVREESIRPAGCASGGVGDSVN